ncbi:hypothetical protein Ct9H90mP29_22680 [bacterium]|nr:MAG: hypothetical protein Ct9H90mP29_22680 [bacterium]
MEHSKVLKKAETAAEYGEEQVHIWRRSYTVPPPKLDSDDERHPRFDINTLLYNQISFLIVNA